MQGGVGVTDQAPNRVIIDLRRRTPAEICELVADKLEAFDPAGHIRRKSRNEIWENVILAIVALRMAAGKLREHQAEEDDGK